MKFEVFWKCKCGYMMSQSQYKATVIDFMCCRCQKVKLSSYEMVKMYQVAEYTATTKLEDVGPNGFKYKEFN